MIRLMFTGIAGIIGMLLILAGPTNSLGDGKGEELSEKRHISLEGQSNFRDIGGYKTTDGRTVKWGEVYRTGELPRLTDEDVAVLKKLDLQMVHNFLLEEEIAQRGQDRLPSSTQLVKNPI